MTDSVSGKSSIRAIRGRPTGAWHVESAQEVHGLYTRRFFQAFGAVILFMTGVALQFHFGQYVEHLGYGVDTLGCVLGLSTVGVLLIRLHLGRWVDRFGCRRMWIGGACISAVSLGTMQFANSPWQIVVLRAVSAMAAAGVMTSVAVVAARIAPPRRRAESIGMLGLAGLGGIMIGPAIGDWIFAAGTVSMLPYRVFFMVSALLSLASAGVVALVGLPKAHATFETASTDGGTSASVARSTWHVVRNHWPGSVMLIGFVFAAVFCVQSLFLERLAEARSFGDIKAFFFVYCPTAITLRIVFRRLPERAGRTRTMLLGMVLQAIGLLFLVGVESQWHLAWPGFLMGAGHCFVFPSMVDLAADHAPPEHRGVATALILGAGDVGTLIGYSVLGVSIDVLGHDQTLSVLAASVAATVSFVAVSRRHVVFRRR